MADTTQTLTCEIKNGPGKLDLAHALMQGAEVEFIVQILGPSQQPRKLKTVIRMVQAQNDTCESWKLEGRIQDAGGNWHDFVGPYSTDSHKGLMRLIGRSTAVPDQLEQQEAMSLNMRARNRKQFKPDTEIAVEFVPCGPDCYGGSCCNQ